MDDLISSFEKLDITLSQRGGKLLIYKNFEYKIDYIAKTANKYTWRCNQDPECKARCYTHGLDHLLNENEHEHSHPAKPAKIEIRQAINKMKEIAKTNQQTARLIIQQSQTNLSNEAQALMPSYDSLRQRLNHCKENPYEHLPKPSCLKEIFLHE